MIVEWKDDYGSSMEPLPESFFMCFHLSVCGARNRDARDLDLNESLASVAIATIVAACYNSESSHCKSHRAIESLETI